MSNIRSWSVPTACAILGGLVATCLTVGFGVISGQGRPSRLVLKDSAGVDRLILDETGIQLQDVHGNRVFLLKASSDAGSSNVTMLMGPGFDLVGPEIPGTRISELCFSVTNGVPVLSLRRPREEIHIDVESGVRKQKF